MNKEVKQILRKLEQEGLTWEITKTHIKVRGRHGKTVGIVPKSPRGHRWRKNLLSELRRNGLIK